MAKRLPREPNLEHLKKQAKHLLQDYRAGHAAASARFKALFPKWADAPPQALKPAAFTLKDAQRVIAREYGFAHWSALRQALEKARGSRQLLCSFCGQGIEQVNKIIQGPRIHICDHCVQAFQSTPAPAAASTWREDRCSFCSRPADLDLPLYGSAPEARICPACIKLCVEVLSQEAKPSGEIDDREE